MSASMLYTPRMIVTIHVPDSCGLLASFFRKWLPVLAVMLLAQFAVGVLVFYALSFAVSFDLQTGVLNTNPVYEILGIALSYIAAQAAGYSVFCGRRYAGETTWRKIAVLHVVLCATAAVP